MEDTENLIYGETECICAQDHELKHTEIGGDLLSIVISHWYGYRVHQHQSRQLTY